MAVIPLQNCKENLPVGTDETVLILQFQEQGWTPKTLRVDGVRYNFNIVKETESSTLKVRFKREGVINLPENMDEIESLYFTEVLLIPRDDGEYLNDVYAVVNEADGNYIEFTI